MITSITSTLIREGCSITSITSYIFGSNGSITSSLLQIVLHYYTITSITSSSLLHKHFHYFPLVGKVMGSNGSITSYYVPPQLGDVPHQAVSRQVEIGFDVERFHQIRIVGVGREYDEAVLLTTTNHI